MTEEQYNEILSRLAALETDIGDLKTAYSELVESGGVSTAADCTCTYEIDKATIYSKLSALEASQSTCNCTYDADKERINDAITALVEQVGKKVEATLSNGTLILTNVT